MLIVIGLWPAGPTAVAGSFVGNCALGDRTVSDSQLTCDLRGVCNNYVPAVPATCEGAN